MNLWRPLGAALLLRPPARGQTSGIRTLLHECVWQSVKSVTTPRSLDDNLFFFFLDYNSGLIFHVETFF